MTLPRVVRVYAVTDGRITGYRNVTQPRPTSALATAPQPFHYPTFADPDAERALVRVLRGRLADEYVSPDDPGVSWSEAAPAPGP
ncbi:MAG: hypothetical protein U0869_08760 [Chloroflexota bacterium]